MKLRNRWFGIVLVAVMAFGLLTAVPVEAASVNVTIALSSSSLKVGDALTVTVSVKCSEAIGSYSMAVTYNSDVIEYTDGAGSGGNGTVNIAGYGDGSQTTLKTTLKFKAVASGSTTITTTGGEAYTWNEETASLSHAGAKVTVSAADTASTDNTLSALSVSPGSLSPAFSSSTTSYTVRVGADTADLVVSATPNDSNATVSVSGNKGLKTGDNTVKVTVKAQSGAKKTYKIICTKAAGTTTETTETTQATTTAEEVTPQADTATTQAGAITVLIDGVTYTFAQSTEGLDIPEGFTETVSVYQEQEVMTFAGPDEAIMLACLLDDTGAQTWFMYEESTGGFLSYSEMNTALTRLFIMKAKDDVEVPDDYRSVEIDLNGQIIPGFISENNSEIILVYAKKINGDEGLYYYDTIENGFIRYIPEEQESEEAKEDTDEWSDTFMDGNYEEPGGTITYDSMKYVTASTLIVSLVLLVAMCFLYADNLSLQSRVRFLAHKIMEMPDDTDPAEHKRWAFIPDEYKQTEQTEQTEQAGDNAGNMTDTKESDLEEKAAAVVAKLSLDEEKDDASSGTSDDTAPVPMIQLEDDDS